MEEDIRLKVIKKIELLKAEKRKYLELKKELELLLKNDTVKKYLDTVTSLEVLEHKKHILLNKNEDIINYCFQSSIYNYRKFCCHDIWIYMGSYYIVDDYERSYNVKLNNENDCKFDYNLYKCLECGDEFVTKDYINFENNHLVLKKYGKIDFYKLQKLYFKYLSTDSQKNVCKKITKSFYQNY